MPGGDRTGPMGMGPMTGRGAGYCAGSAAAGFANRVYGGGFGRGRGAAAVVEEVAEAGDTCSTPRVCPAGHEPGVGGPDAATTAERVRVP